MGWGGLAMLQRITLPLLVLGPGGAAWSSTSPFHSQTGLSQQQHHYRQQPQLGVAKLPIAEPDKSEGQIAEEMSRAQRLIDFLDACPEPFHVTAVAAAKFRAAGFVELSEKELWGQRKRLEPGGKYFYIRNRSSLVAFTVGGACVVDDLAFKVIGAHTDSPALKVKPRSKRGGSGLSQVNVECYGGGLWHTWFDRDLSVAGRVVVQCPSDGGDKSGAVRFEQRLVHLKDPILRVPTLCIHLQSAVEREAFKVNKEDHLVPILCGQVKESLTGGSKKEDDSGVGSSAAEDEPKKEGEVSDWCQGQNPVLLELLRDALDLKVGEEVVDFELTLYDTQGAAFGGAKKEFINGARLDNLASSFIAVEALIDHASTTASDGEVPAAAADDEDGAKKRSGDESGTAAANGSTRGFENDRDVSLVALFDHEEVGSESSVGAGSPIMRDAVERITHALATAASQSSSSSLEEEEEEEVPKSTPGRMTMGGRRLGSAVDGEVYRAALARSLVLSVDMAHAVHPNYASKHEKGHGPKMNAGIVIKSNSNQRYATNGVTGFLVREMGRRSGVPLQEFVVRNDCPCGSTIGPILSANLGVRVVDLGMPQLSMHSCREMMGRADLTLASKLFRSFLQDFRQIDEQLSD